MISQKIKFGLFAALLGTAAGCAIARPAAEHSFQLGKDDFLLDGKPFQLIGCEMHPARIPAEYWQHRLRMAKAMGCNTIPIYVFWNYHELSEGKFDFSTGNRDLPRFLRLAKEEGLMVALRPGPYTCAEWDLGGIPPYLLSIPDIKLRGRDPRYMRAVSRYVSALAKVIKPFEMRRGGPLVMLQVENEYGSYANDRGYISELARLWRANGIALPFYTADGPSAELLGAGTLAGAAVGLDSGKREADWTLARQINPGVPVFSAETYPGWMTPWGKEWARPSVDKLKQQMEFLLSNKKSFSLYVVHGGTNFGFSAGANGSTKDYAPDVTSYDYDAPINEQGRPTAKYLMLRDLIAQHTGRTPPPIPAPIPAMAIPEFELRPLASVWDLLPKPVHSNQPKTFEALGQYQGLVLYRTTLVGAREGKLEMPGLHDFATVFLDGRLVGTIDRRLGQDSILIPKSTAAAPVLDILVEAMGRINFGPDMIDRKGIIDRATLNEQTMMNWEMFGLPLKEAWVDALRAPAHPDTARPGQFFSGSFTLDQVADTYIDLSKYRKGVVWVNGHNLGRFWEIGPQTRLYCPASWLKRGVNKIVVFDMLKTEAASVGGFAEPSDAPN